MQSFPGPQYRIESGGPPGVFVPRSWLAYIRSVSTAPVRFVVIGLPRAIRCGVVCDRRIPEARDVYRSRRGHLPTPSLATTNTRMCIPKVRRMTFVAHLSVLSSWPERYDVHAKRRGSAQADRSLLDRVAEAAISDTRKVGRSRVATTSNIRSREARTSSGTPETSLNMAPVTSTPPLL